MWSSENELTLFTNPLIGVEVCLSDGTLVDVNQAYGEFLGLSSEELRGQKVDEFCHGDDIPAERDSREAALSAKPFPPSAVRRMISSSGRTIWVEVIRTAQRKDNDAVIVSMVRNITTERRARLLQEGRNSVLELLYQGLPLEEICHQIVTFIEGLGEGMLCSILRLDNKNQTLHRLAAPSLPEEYNSAIEGMAIGDGVGSCGTAAFRGERVIVADLLDHPYWERARRLAERSGLRACWSEPIIASGGQVLGTFALYYRKPREPEMGDLELIRSVADLTALVISYCRATEELKAADQAKDDFISTAAHELRTPLAAILGFTELLVKKNTFGPFSDAEKQDFLSEISAKGELLARLIDDLFDVSRLQNNLAMPLELKPGSLYQTVMNVVEQFRRQYPSCSIVTPDSENFPEKISFDRLRITQVIQNLISNAVKYSPLNSEVTVSVELDEERVILSVADCGIGMSREQVERMFEKYYRADSSDSSPSGLGLGLHIARHIVEAHGGRMMAASQPGEGTRVEFSLPRERSA